MNRYPKKLTILSILVFVIVSSACTTKVDNSSLPPPDEICSTKLNWHGLIPGLSTREDVLDILGSPLKKGKLKLGDLNISYFSYQVPGGEIADYASDRIFFRSDGVVDWMEIIEVDRDGKFKTVFNSLELVGRKVDVLYPNNNFRPSQPLLDILAGPDQIYVWSGCGLAIDALPATYSLFFQNNIEICKSNANVDISKDPCKLEIQHPSPFDFGSAPNADVNSIVLMNFYFQPTSYSGFTSYYMSKISYGLWNEYLAMNK